MTTKTPRPSYDEEVAAILEDWLEDAQATSMLGMTIDDNRTDDDRDRDYIEALQKATAALIALHEREVQRIIGEDEEPMEVAKYKSKLRRYYQNQLRAEQRKRAALTKEQEQ